MSEEISLYKKRIEEKIKNISKDMKHCKFEQFKVLMTTLDMGVEIKGTSVSPAEKTNPFSNIYFCEKNSNKAEKLDWKDIPVLPVPP